MYFQNQETTALLLVSSYFHECLVCFKSPKEHLVQLNISMGSQNYAKCLQTQYDNRRDFNVKEMSIFDLPVDLTSKLH